MQLDYGFVKKIHEKLFAQLCFLDEVLSDSNLPYSLWAGTLLGSVRERNFISWDDDADIILHRKDYDRAVLLLKSIQVSSSDISFEFLRDTLWLYRLKSKVVIDGVNFEATTDFFVLDNAFRNRLIHRIHVLLITVIQTSLKTRVNYKKGSKISHVIQVLIITISALVPRDKKLRFYDVICSLVKKNTGFLFLSNTSRAHLGKRFKTAGFDLDGKAFLRNKEFPIFKEYDIVLSKLYGHDYMVPPVISERRPKHNSN